MTKLIPVRFTLVDDDTYEELCQYRWYCLPSGHVYRSEGGNVILMHRQIVGASDDKLVDHVNGWGADNQRVNLRECTHHENMMNRRPHRTYGGKEPTSPYKGVVLGPNNARPWRARIRINKRDFRLGNYEKEIDAAKAYDAAARFYFGKFSNTNFPGDLALSIEDIRDALANLAQFRQTT